MKDRSAIEKAKKRSAIEKAKKRFVRDIYMNREYSWLLFNKRVLDQACDLTNPLLERCKFLSIFCSNLDEFFMVRVGSLYNDSLTAPDVCDNKTGLTAAKQLSGIMTVVEKLYQSRTAVFVSLRRELAKAGVRMMRAADLTPRQNEECKTYFLTRVMPLLSLMVLDAKHPMIQFENMRNYMMYELERDGRRMIGVLYVNPAVDRLYQLSGGKKAKVMPIEEMLRAYGHLAFMGYTVKNKIMLRVTRNADLDTRVDDSDVEHDFSEFMKKKIETRARLGVVRLEVDDAASPLKDFALKVLKLDGRTASRNRTFSITNFCFPLANTFPPKLRRHCATRPSRAPWRKSWKPRLLSSTMFSAAMCSFRTRTTVWSRSSIF